MYSLARIRVNTSEYERSRDSGTKKVSTKSLRDVEGGGVRVSQVRGRLRARAMPSSRLACDVVDSEELRRLEAGVSDAMDGGSPACSGAGAHGRGEKNGVRCT